MGNIKIATTRLPNVNTQEVIPSNPQMIKENLGIRHLFKKYFILKIGELIK